MANPILSKIKLPSGNVYDLADVFARDQIDTIKKTVAGGVQYVGSTTTELVDGAETATIQIDGKDYTPAVGDMVDAGNVLYIFNKSSQWDELGAAGPLKALAYKDSVEASYTPAGEVSQPAFTGKAGDVKVSGTATGTISAPAFTGKAGTVSVSGTPKGSVAVSSSAPAEGEAANYTPTGKVAVTPTTETIKQVTSVGTLPSWEASVVDETLEFSWAAGTLPESADATVATGVESATFTGDGQVIKGAFTGEASDSTGSFTPTGEVAAPEFTGTAFESTGSFTPEGEVAKPTFTGTQATITSK